jgi:mycothiol synthase
MAEIAIRPGRGEDLAGIHAVANAHHRAVDEPVSTLAERRELWTRGGFDPARDVRVAVEDGTILAFGELRPDGDVRVNVLPAHEGAGIHETLLAALEDEARARGVDLLSAIASDRDEAALAVHRGDGWTPSREVWRMWVEHEEEPPPARLPAGVEIRTYTDAVARDVHRLLDDAYLDWDEEYRSVPHEEWLSFMTTGSDFDPACWFLAEAEGRLEGVCLNWATGWVKDVAVRPKWRRRGLGEALLRHSLHALYRRGVRRVGLKVDSNNGTGAPRLYERLGFVTDRRYTMFVKRL